MNAFIEGIKWLLVNYGLSTLSLVVSVGVFLWLMFRNAGADTLKTVNSLVLLNSEQLVQLQADYRDLMAKYIEILKTSGETVGRAMLADNKLQNFMVLSESNKAEWVLERAGLKKDIADANAKLDSQSAQILELKQQVQELLLLVSKRDAEIADLKEDNPVSESNKEHSSKSEE